jgi:hypothetical protein
MGPGTKSPTLTMFEDPEPEGGLPPDPINPG